MTKRTILIVDDDRGTILVLSQMLSDLGQLRFATSGAEALRLAEQSPPDLILLDVEMPGMNGFEVCQRLKERSELADVPVIFVTSHDSEEEELRGLNVGAVDFISKPPRATLVNARARVHLRVKELSDALRHAAVTDGLTGIANRRQLDDMLAREWARAQRSGRPVSLLLIDVDHFKAYNDRYGHRQGDRCLQQIAGALRDAAMRATDLVARYGGEEFSLLLPDTDRPGAELVAQRARANVASLRLPHEASAVSPHVSVSLGLATYTPIAGAFSGTVAPPALRSDVGALVECADRALYAAKRAGRDRVYVLQLGGAELAEPCAVSAPDHALNGAKRA